MKAKRQIESSLNSVTMLDGTGGHVIFKVGRGCFAGSGASERASWQPIHAGQSHETPLWEVAADNGSQYRFRSRTRFANSVAHAFYLGQPREYFGRNQ
jgi:hypothetical protein